jgi:hypothetical protein
MKCAIANRLRNTSLPIHQPKDCHQSKRKARATPYGRYFYWQHKIVVNKNKLWAILTGILIQAGIEMLFSQQATMVKL